MCFYEYVSLFHLILYIFFLSNKKTKLFIIYIYIFHYLKKNLHNPISKGRKKKKDAEKARVLRTTNINRGSEAEAGWERREKSQKRKKRYTKAILIHKNQKSTEQRNSNEKLLVV